MEKDYRELYEKITNSDWFKKAYHNKSLGECPIVVEGLEESEDERIRKGMIDEIKAILRGEDIEFPPQDVLESRIAYLEKQKEQKPIEMEVNEIGKGTTICGQGGEEAQENAGSR